MCVNFYSHIVSSSILDIFGPSTVALFTPLTPPVHPAIGDDFAFEGSVVDMHVIFKHNCHILCVANFLKLFLNQAHTWFTEIGLAKTACLHLGMSVQHLHEQTGFELQKINLHSMNKGCLCTVLKLNFLFSLVF